MSTTVDVAFVTSLAVPLLAAQAAGPQALVCDLAQGLAERGHRVTLYCARATLLPQLTDVVIVQIPVDPMAAEARVMPLGQESQAIEALGVAFQQMFVELRRRGHEVISQHAYDAEAVDLSRGLALLHTIHLPPLGTRVPAALRRAAEPRVTVSHACARLWVGAGVTIGVIPNGVPSFAVDAGPVEDVALIAGRISPEKGVACAVRVARRAGLKPLVVGDVYDRAYFDSEVAPLLEPDEVSAAVPRDQLWKLMARSRVCLAAVRWEEPFGLTFAEAQVAGCPVAGFRRGGLPEIVEEGVSGVLVEADDESALMAAVVKAGAFDRAEVRRSGLARLSLAPVLETYESVLMGLRR